MLPIRIFIIFLDKKLANILKNSKANELNKIRYTYKAQKIKKYNLQLQKDARFNSCIVKKLFY